MNTKTTEQNNIISLDTIKPTNQPIDCRTENPDNFWFLKRLNNTSIPELDPKEVKNSGKAKIKQFQNDKQN